MNKKVAVQADLVATGKELLKNNGFEVIELPNQKISTLLEMASDAFGIIWGTAPFPNEVVEKMPNLKIIARNGVGFDNLDVNFMDAHGIYVTITPLANAATVAETTMAEIFALSKNLMNDSIEMRKGNWNYKKSHKGFDLAGKTLGILGYGRIGKLVAQKMDALDMNILVYSPNLHDPAIGRAVDRDTIFKEADVITLHMPVVPATKQGITAREFKMMKATAVIINLARGKLINTTDLISALKNGEISGATLDVFDEEPLPINSELAKLDNVFLTPHIASNTVECMNRMALDAASEIIRVGNDEQPRWNIFK